MIQNYCKQYRLSKGVILKELTNGKQIKTLSTFENSEKSGNIQHLETYIKLSIRLGDYKNFMKGLKALFDDKQ